MKLWINGRLPNFIPEETPEACIALDQVVAKRGIDLAKLKQIEAEEWARKTAYENEQELLAKKKEARYFKWFLIIGTPIIIFGALFRTEKFYETVVSTLVQGCVYWFDLLGLSEIQASKKSAEAIVMPCCNLNFRSSAHSAG